MSIYAARIREAQTGAIDTGKLAEAWLALHPDLGKAGRHDDAGEDRGGTGRGSRAGDRTGAPRRGAGTARAATPATPGYPGAAGVALAGPGARIPADVSKAVSPALAAFLAAAARALRSALRAVLGDLWTEGWVLGQLAAQSVLTGDRVDWRGWTPADHDAAAQIAGDGLARLLADADITIQSIAETRTGELADVLEAALASDVTEIEAYHKPPGVYSMQNVLPARNSIGDLAAKLEDVLDNPARARMVAHTEMARAASAATMESYESTGVREKSWLGAGDARECPVCDANGAQGAVPVGEAFSGGVLAPPQHPLCRCALMPVVAS